MSLTLAGHHRAARTLSHALALASAVAIIAVTSLSAPTSAAQYGGDPTASAGFRGVGKDVRRTKLAGASAKKAVVVVGPVGSSTTKYKEKGEAIADAAEGWGMEVVRLFTPCATWAKVKEEAMGADLFVYLGHGNGFPQPGEVPSDFQEDTRNGVGLNPSCGTDNTTTKYYGANRLRESIQLAPNAVVLLNKLCYAEGNSVPGHPIPSTDIARTRVDGYAAGFLDIGAKVVFALGWQPGENVVDSLFDTTPRTMDEVFHRRFGSNRDGSYKPYFGWIGWKPNLYFDSERTPGARLQLDPDADEGFLRAVTGDLEFTTSQWLGNIDPSDTEPPVITALTATQAANTRPAGENALPVFTPNGDKLSDSITFRYTVSEGAFLKVEIKREDGGVMRKFTEWSPAGQGSSSWDGKNENGKKVPDGRYDVVVTPKDQAGNVGDPVTISVKSLTAIKSPTVAPALFDPTDGDTLAQSTTLGVTLTKEATITWRILNDAGDVVRRGMQDQLLAVGPASWAWDGLDDAGQPVPQGTYTSLVTASTEAGTYSHMATVRLMTYNVKLDKTVNVGQSQKVTILTAEPVSGWPVITVKQPGVAAYRLYPTRWSTTKFTATWKVKSGASGNVTITISSTDSAGGTQSKTFKATIS